MMDDTRTAMDLPSIRYLALGDSFTIGTGTTPDKAFPAVLAGKWREAGRTVELLNPAVNGHTTDDLIVKQLPHVAVFKPTLVTLLIGATDIVRGRIAVRHHRGAPHADRALQHDRDGRGRARGIAVRRSLPAHASAGRGRDAGAGRAAPESRGTCGVGVRDRTAALTEVPFVGGNLSNATRVNDTVRRVTGPWTPAVHAVLRHLEARGFDGACRVRGIDDRGREILGYIDGDAPTGWPDPYPAWVWTAATLESAAPLLRRYHDAIADFVPPADAAWRQPAGPPPHHPLSHNTVGPF